MDKYSSSESIIILIENDDCNPSAILYGYQLAERMGCAFHVWYIVQKHEEKNSQEQLDYNLEESKMMSIYYGAKSFNVSVYRSEQEFTNSFKELINKLQVTKIVLPGIIENHLYQTFYGTTIKFLINNFLDIDIHFASRKLTFPYGEGKYERGKMPY